MPSSLFADDSPPPSLHHGRRRLTYPSQTAVLRYLPVTLRTALLSAAPSIRNFERCIPYTFDLIECHDVGCYSCLALDGLFWGLVETEDDRLMVICPSRWEETLDVSGDDVFDVIFKYYLDRPGTIVKTFSCNGITPIIPMAPLRIDRMFLNIDEWTKPPAAFFDLFRSARTVFGEIEVDNKDANTSMFSQFKGLKVDRIKIRTVEVVDDSLVIWSFPVKQLEILETMLFEVDGDVVINRDALPENDNDDGDREEENEEDEAEEEDEEDEAEAEEAEEEQVRVAPPRLFGQFVRRRERVVDNDIPEDVADAVERLDEFNDEDDEQEGEEEAEVEQEEQEEEVAGEEDVAEVPEIIRNYFGIHFMTFVARFRHFSHLRINSEYTMRLDKQKLDETIENPMFARKLAEMGAERKRYNGLQCMCIPLSEDKELVVFHEEPPHEENGMHRLTVRLVPAGASIPYFEEPPVTVKRTLLDYIMSLVSTIQSVLFFRFK